MMAANAQGDADGDPDDTVPDCVQAFPSCLLRFAGAISIGDFRTMEALTAESTVLTWPPVRP